MNLTRGQLDEILQAMTPSQLNAWFEGGKEVSLKDVFGDEEQVEIVEEEEDEPEWVAKMQAMTPQEIDACFKGGETIHWKDIFGDCDWEEIDEDETEDEEPIDIPLSELKPLVKRIFGKNIPQKIANFFEDEE